MTQLYQDLTALDKAFATEKDWIKGGYERILPDGKKCHCLIGKMAVVVGVPANSLCVLEPRIRAMVGALGFAFPAEAIQYNDSYAKFPSLKELIGKATRAHRPKKPLKSKRAK